jgi:hypothetical protein
MSDGTSAEMFGEMFRTFAEDPSPQHIRWAHKLWGFTGNYDFSSYQLDCDEALITLKLARKRMDPKTPEDGKVMFYGPKGEDRRR